MEQNQDQSKDHKPEASGMPLTEHLSELRQRLIVPVISVSILFLITFWASEKIFNALMFPLRSELRFSTTEPFISIAAKKPINLVFLAPAEAFWMHMKLSFVSAIVLSLPLIFFQAWRFISPGLLRKEKKYIAPFIVSATTLFVGGSLFCFFIVLPFALTFLLGYKTENMLPMISIGNYVDFCLKFILAFGVIFELPLVIIFLTRLGLVSTRTLARNRKYAVLFAFIAAAILTPTPDAFNQALMAVPIIILFEIGILFSKLLSGKESNGTTDPRQKP